MSGKVFAGKAGIHLDRVLYKIKIKNYLTRQNTKASFGSVTETKMEAYVKSKLNTKVFKKGGGSSGCINQGNVYDTDEGKVFIKCNSGAKANVMFRGECESLKELSKTKTVKVPKPLLVGEVGKESFIVMEYIDMRSLRKHSSILGKSLAELHLHNVENLRKRDKREGFVGSQVSAVEKFGFHVTTACGYLPQNNEWSDDWINFYLRQKLQQQIDLILENDGNREIVQLWSELQLKIPSFFKDISIQPSLLHGDLWIGNAGETDTEPVIYDPASFYGHHEYDLAIAVMFGGFSGKFFDSYHSLIPKSQGFKQRQELYLLFHHLNHWNHFGSHKSSSLHIMRDLIK